jgi:hypothetical protein
MEIVMYLAGGLTVLALMWLFGVDRTRPHRRRLDRCRDRLRRARRERDWWELGFYEAAEERDRAVAWGQSERARREKRLT